MFGVPLSTLYAVNYYLVSQIDQGLAQFEYRQKENDALIYAGAAAVVALWVTMAGIVLYYAPRHLKDEYKLLQQAGEFYRQQDKEEEEYKKIAKQKKMDEEVKEEFQKWRESVGIADKSDTTSTATKVNEEDAEEIRR